jgi:hypothetical protein
MPAPSNIAAAALVMQLCIVGILSFGALRTSIHQKWNVRFYENPTSATRHAGVSFVLAVFTVGFLLFSDQFSTLWRPLSGSVDLGFVSWAHALPTVFILDILWIAYLIHFTEGSYHSPFTPVYFILPAMAFFLRESVQRVILYTTLVGIAFIIGFFAPPRERRDSLFTSRRDYEEPVRLVGTYLVISIGCFVLSVIIGLMTRPSR